MRVLWLSATPSLFDESKIGGWIASLERLMRKYYPNIDFGIAFEYDSNISPKRQSNITYYPYSTSYSIFDKIKSKISSNFSCAVTKSKIKEIISDFNPDIIHCFGSEWNYALISLETSIPVVIHMQGFLNIYNLSDGFAISSHDYYKAFGFNPFKMIKHKLRLHRQKVLRKNELEIMRNCHYFMGRTLWDENIVKYYSPNAIYFHCNEAIRHEIKNSDLKWQFNRHKRMRIVSISSAGSLKGNEIILRTAKILKDFNFDFEWIVAGRKNIFQIFENKTGINHSDVNIKLLGMIPASDVAKYLSHNDVYVHPAIIDNSPNSLCEAQLIGIPVISANVGGIPQLVENNHTGILYPYNEPHTLAFILMNIHGDEKTLSQLSLNELSIAHKRHNEEKIATRVVEIYNKIITLNNNGINN